MYLNIYIYIYIYTNMDIMYIYIYINTCVYIYIYTYGLASALPYHGGTRITDHGTIYIKLISCCPGGSGPRHQALLRLRLAAVEEELHRILHPAICLERLTRCTESGRSLVFSIGISRVDPTYNADSKCS